MAISNLTPVEPWPSRKLPQDRFDASVKTAMDQMSVLVGELNDAFIPAANETAEAIDTLNPDLPAILDAPNQAAAAAASAEAAAGSADAAAESVSAAAQEVEKAKGEVVNAQAEVERAKDEADRAKAEADRAESIAGVGPATVEKLGLVKPDGKTTQTTEDGTLSVPTFDGDAAGLVPAATPEDARKALLGDGTWGSVEEEEAAAMTISEDLILTADSPRTLVLKASASGMSVRLPDPATLTKGTTFHIIVRSLEDIQLCDFSGQVVKAYPVLSVSTAIRVQLVDPSTGLWALSKYESGSTSDAQYEPGLHIEDLIIFCSNTTSYLSVAALSESKALVCYVPYGGGSDGTACILSISGTTVTVGAEKVFNNGTTSDISVAALSESKALVCYRDTDNSGYGTACILSISGTTVTVGAEKVFNNGTTSDISVTALSESKALVCYQDTDNSGYGTTCVLSISGTTVTAGAAKAFKGWRISDISVTALSDSKALVCYRDDLTSNYGTTCVLSISGTTVTAGAEKVFNSANTSYISVAALSESKALVCYQDIENSNYGTACVLSISGTTVTAGAEKVFNGRRTAYISVTALSESKALVCYQDIENSNYGTTCVLSISGTTVTVGAEKVFKFANTQPTFVTVLPFSEGKALVAFGADNSGQSCVLYLA